MIFHIVNRGLGRMRLFLKDADYDAFGAQQKLGHNDGDLDASKSADDADRHD